MSNLPHILLVDDDPMMREIERHQLGDEHYRFSDASDGLEALRSVAADKPEVILLDILMPGLDGTETCRRLRENPDNADIHIIFVTGQDDPETRLAAYEAGGDDLLLKPLKPGELQLKLDNVMETRGLVAGLRKEVAETRDVLMNTLISSGEYGLIMNALRQSLGCKSLGDLADVTLKALDDFRLAGSVQLRTGREILTLNSQRRSSPLEQEMLLKLSLENRHIYDYGSRSVFCYPNTAILVKDMPVDDPVAYGRVKDNLALLAEAVEYRLKSLLEEIQLRQNKETLVGCVALASQVLDQVEGQYKKGQSEMSSIFGQLERDLEWAFSGLGLTDAQESGLWQIVHPLRDRAASLYDEGRALDAQLDGAMKSLKLSLEEAGGQLGGQDLWL